MDSDLPCLLLQLSFSSSSYSNCSAEKNKVKWRMLLAGKTQFQLKVNNRKVEHCDSRNYSLAMKIDGKALTVLRTKSTPCHAF